MPADYSLLRIVALVVLCAIYQFQVQRREWFRQEIKRNDEFEPPSDQQGRWDLRHMREDLYMITVTLHYLAYLGTAYVVVHW